MGWGKIIISAVIREKVQNMVRNIKLIKIIRVANWSGKHLIFASVV